MALTRACSSSAAAWMVAGVLLAGAPASGKTAGPADEGQVAFQRGLAADLGQGEPADPALALHYYRISAEQGDPDAELNLAVMLDSGVGTRSDPAAAALWYGRAAAHGVGRAAYDLGQLLADGVGVARNLPLAAAWFGQAAREGIEVAGARQRSLLKTPDDEGPNLSPPRTLSPATGATLGGADAEFVWQPSVAMTGLRYWVQVIPLDDPGRTTAYQETDVSSLLVRLPANGRYAWRVFAASASSGRYEASAWSAFTLARHDECCLASLTNR